MNDPSPDIRLVGDDEILSADQLEVLSRYFPHLRDSADLIAYFQGNSLGQPDTRLIYWQDQEELPVSNQKLLRHVEERNQ